MLVLHENVLDKALKIINFIKSKPLSTRLFHILCDNKERTNKALLLHTKVPWLSQGKAFIPSFELEGELSACFVEYYFHLKEQVTNYGYSILGIWQIFS